MRDIVRVKLGGEEVDLLPAYSVMDAFEDRHTGLPEHLERLLNGRAKIQERAFLILKAAEAADPEADFQQSAVQEGMFQVGAWHEDLITKEAELIERLMYTPKQYIEKKSAREEEAKLAMEAMQETFSNDFLGSQP